MKTFLPILATLALAAGLYAPVVRSMLARRTAASLADVSRVHRDWASARPVVQVPSDDLPSVRTEELSRDAADIGPPGPVDPVAISLGSGWWLTPPGDVVDAPSARNAILSGCAGSVCARSVADCGIAAPPTRV